MASRYFAAGKIHAGWFHGRKLSQHKQERDVDCPAPLASQRGSDAQVWGMRAGRSTLSSKYCGVRDSCPLQPVAHLCLLDIPA